MTLRFWVIYHNPTDAPDKFVVRVHEIRPGQRDPVPLDDAQIRDTLEQARACIPSGLLWIPRSENDERQIVETWF